MPAIDLSPVRQQFPALGRIDAGRTPVFFDGPGGTQVPRRVIDAISHYLAYTNANHGGPFRTSRESDALLEAAHQAMADFLNARSAREIVMGPNMTTLTFQFSRSIGQSLAAGDEIIITRLDHDANRAPWQSMIEKGVIIREVDFDPTECSLRLDELAGYLNPRTRVVAVGYASNIVGSINPIPKIAQMAHSVGAWLWVDAVHYAPHGPIDVQALGCDFLVCSAYKFFGPHAGVVWGREDLLERLPSYKVRPAGNRPPDKFETGTQNHEAQAGVLAGIEYLAELGEKFGSPFAEDFPGFQGRRRRLKQAMAAIQIYERNLFEHFVGGLLAIPGLNFYGLQDPSRFHQRTPTAAFNLAGRSPRYVAEELGKRGIYVWAGNFYALAFTERLGLEKTGGVVRAGLVHYNTREEVDYCLKCLRDLV